MATDRDIDGFAQALMEAIRTQQETVAVEAAVSLVTIFLKTQIRIADLLEARPGYCAPKPLSEMRFGGG